MVIFGVRFPSHVHAHSHERVKLNEMGGRI
jgi:hypothetical protein